MRRSATRGARHDARSRQRSRRRRRVKRWWRDSGMITIPPDARKSARAERGYPGEQVSAMEPQRDLITEWRERRSSGRQWRYARHHPRSVRGDSEADADRRDAGGGHRHRKRRRCAVCQNSRRTHQPRTDRARVFEQHLPMRCSVCRDTRRVAGAAYAKRRVRRVAAFPHTMLSHTNRGIVSSRARARQSSTPSDFAINERLLRENNAANHIQKVRR